MTDINPAAASAREDSRQTSGQFGAQENTAPELTLSEPFGPDSPVTATIVYEEYLSEFDEHPRQVATQNVNVRSILDTADLEGVGHVGSGMGDADWIHDVLSKQGALTHPDYPFEVRVDQASLDAYYDHREANGLAEPVAEAAEPALTDLVAVVAARNSDIAALRDQLAEAETQREAAEEHVLRAVITKRYPTTVRAAVQIDHHRYPVELFDTEDNWVNIGEANEFALASEIRTLLGDDPLVVGGRGTARLVELHPGE